MDIGCYCLRARNQITEMPHGNDSLRIKDNKTEEVKESKEGDDYMDLVDDIKSPEEKDAGENVDTGDVMSIISSNDYMDIQLDESQITIPRSISPTSSIASNITASSLSASKKGRKMKRRKSNLKSKELTLQEIFVSWDAI